MIKIICVGKVKEKYFREAIEEYTKRLSKYTKLEIIEVNDIDNDNIDIIITKEKELIEKHIGSRDFVVTMEIEGNMLSSEELANKIDNLISEGVGNYCFVIGGSLGNGENVKKRANFAISFSRLTFTHQMIRLLLLEQIYRVFKINNNETYHK